MKRLSLVLLLVACSGGLIFAGGSRESTATPAPAAAAAPQRMVLTLAEADTLGTPINIGNATFAKLVTERTNGMITVNHIQGEQLGNDVQVIEQLMEGSVQFYGDVVAWYANWVKDFGILNWGFTFDNNDHAQRFFESATFGRLKDELAQKAGIRILGAAPNDPRILFASKPIRTLAELQNLKMRVPDIRTYMLLWQTFGTSPNRVAWGEVYLGMRTGLLEAAEGPTAAAYGAKFHEVGRHVTLTNHLVSDYQIAMNNDLFESFPPATQQLLLQAGQEAANMSRKVAEENNLSTLAKMEQEGATLYRLTPQARAEFVARSESAVATMEADGEWSRGLWQEVRNLAR